MVEPEIARWIVNLVIPGLAGLLGVALGAWLTGRRERRQRKYAFIGDQLRYFYSPLLGIRSEIQMRTELRLKISSAADSAWRQLCSDAQPGGPVALQQLTRGRSEEFRKIIEYDNRKLREELLPAYRQMTTVFRENLWLADPDTRDYFRGLLEYVDIWDRWLERSLPPEVLEQLNHSEATLHPFYEHLQLRHDKLRSRLARGDV